MSPIELKESLTALQAVIIEAPAFIISMINDKLPGGNNGRGVAQTLADSLEIVSEYVDADTYLHTVLDTLADDTEQERFSAALDNA